MNQSNDDFPKLSPDDLRWSAFVYVSGEMSPEESHAFELRLAIDQTAREAVAEATELSCMVSLAETANESEKLMSASLHAIESESTRHVSQRYVGTLLGALAVATLFCVGMLALNGVFSSSDSVQSSSRIDSGAAASDSEQLVRLWVATRTEWSQFDFGVEFDGDGSGIRPDSETDVEVGDDFENTEDLEGTEDETDVDLIASGGEDDWDRQEFDQEVTAPAWMLVGLQGLTAQNNKGHVLPETLKPSQGQLQ